MDTYPIIKYIFLLILFIFSFICAYSEQIEITGFVSILIVHVVFSLCIAFDIISDKNRNLKSLILPSTSTKISNEISIPLYLFMFPIIALQFREILTVVLEIQKSYKIYGSIKISRDNRVRLNRFKLLFIASTICIFFLTFAYMMYRTVPTSAHLIIFIFIFVAIVIEVINNINVTNISYQMQNTTDG